MWAMPHDSVSQSEGLIVGGKYPKRLESLEIIPLQDSDHQITLVIFRLEKDNNGYEGTPVDEELLRWNRLLAHITCKAFERTLRTHAQPRGVSTKKKSTCART